MWERKLSGPAAERSPFRQESARWWCVVSNEL
jgi:hypothetical protein